MRYQLDRYTPLGVRLDVKQAFKSLSYVRTENGMGALEAVVPLGLMQYEDLRKCQILELWREKNGKLSLQNETAYFLMDWELLSSGGEKLVRLLAYDANWLLSTRIVAYDAGSAQAEMTDYADDMMKAIVTDNLGVDTSGGRDISSYLTIASDLSASQSITKAFSRRNVLRVCQEIAEAATSAGTRTYFDVVRTGIGKFAFRTYTGQRGKDHGRTSSDIRLVGEQYGSFDKITFGTYHSQEVNYVYGGGQGEESNREIVEVSDGDRISVGYPFNRIEDFVDARNIKTTAGVTAEANAGLRDGMPRQVLSGRLQDTDGMQYNIHYGFGDIVTAEAFGYRVDCHVTSVKMKYTPNSGEVIDVRLRGEL